MAFFFSPIWCNIFKLNAIQEDLSSPQKATATADVLIESRRLFGRHVGKGIEEKKAGEKQVDRQKINASGCDRVGYILDV